MTTTSWPRIGVIGAGAVGCYFGGMLARAGAPVTFFGRPGSRSAHMSALRERGLTIDGVEVRETIPVVVADDYTELASAELVLFAVKTLDTGSAAAAIKPHLGESAVVVSLQNGIDNVDQLHVAGIDAIATVVFVAAAIEAPGAVKHRGRGDLIIGDAGRRDEIEGIAARFEAAGVPCPISDDIRRDLWRKLIINSMANATSALTGAPYGQLADFEPTWRVALSVAREAVDVARAEGTELDLDEIFKLGTTVAHAVADATSSTQQDIARGRPTEIDSLNGAIARRGSRLGIPTPANQTLWALVKLREQTSGS
jgi:2-dehydropantoate 2-reductase